MIFRRSLLSPSFHVSFLLNSVGRRTSPLQHIRHYTCQNTRLYINSIASSRRLYSSAAASPKPIPSEPTTTVTISETNTNNSSSRSVVADKQYLNAPLPEMDLKAYNNMGKFVTVWVFSMTLLASIVGVFGYSLWWHLEREKAKKQGIDLDEWLVEFEKTDPVVQKLRQWGLDNTALPTNGRQ